MDSIPEATGVSVGSGVGGSRRSGLFLGSLLFPFDASAKPQFFAAWLCLWSLSWLAVAITGRSPGSWIAGVGAAAVIAIVAATGTAGIAVGVFLGAVLVVLSRRDRGFPRFLAVGLGALGYLLLVAGGALTTEGEPTNVPHGLVAGYEAATRQTCLDCHAIGAEGATPIPHNPARSCGEDDEECWGGRVDCLGCHRYDPALGGPTQLFPPVSAAIALPVSGDVSMRAVGLTTGQLVAAGGLADDG